MEIVKEVFETGNYKWKIVSKTQKTISNYFTNSIDDYVKTRNLCDRNINFEKKCLDEFSEYLYSEKIISTKDITNESILSFIRLKSLSNPKSMDKIGTAISKYLKYLYRNEMILNDYSFIIKVKSNRDKKVRKPAELNHIVLALESINRDSSIGKRDYAIILLSCTKPI